METHYEQSADLEQVRNTLSDIGYSDFQVQNFGTSRDVMIRLPVRDGEDATVQSEKVLAALQADTPNVELRRVEFVGPQVGEELVTNGLLALLCVVIGIMVYLALRFEWKFAIAGVVANFHDVIIILGFFAFFQWEFSLAVLAGVLAVLGYSVNLPQTAAGHYHRGNRRRDYANHFSHDHHAYLYPDHGAVNADLRRANAALLCPGPHYRHLVWYLLICVRCGCHRNVAGHKTGRPCQTGQERGNRSRGRLKLQNSQAQTESPRSPLGCRGLL